MISRLLGDFTGPNYAVASAVGAVGEFLAQDSTSTSPSRLLLQTRQLQE